MSRETLHKHVPVLIVGSGLAGLSCAIELADAGIEVYVATKSDDFKMCNTAWAQGGVAYVDPEDHDDTNGLLVKDIIKSGDGISNPRAVDQVVELGMRLVKEQMIDKVGVPFDRNQDGRLERNHEGAHSKKRVIHVSDGTGDAIQSHYLEAALARKNIHFLKKHLAIDLLTTQHNCSGVEFQYPLENVCCGAYLYDIDARRVLTVTADFTVVATGGVGQLFLHSSNSPGAIGGGMVMAARAGADLLFPHYVQFHPTTLFKGRRRFLISEVVRGAGAHLVNSKGERFMNRYNKEQMELTPRDELTRAIIQELIRLDDDFVILDLSPIATDGKSLQQRFPNIFQACLNQGIDLAKDPKIPVVPAAHYLCGGIKVDLQGKTTLSRLYAIGETSCTGVHGANRLASTALLEALTWGFTCAHEIASKLKHDDHLETNVIEAVRPWQDVDEAGFGLERQRLAGDWSRIRSVMWNYVGILRSRKLLNIAGKDFRLLGENLADLYFKTPLSVELVELFQGIQACQLIVDSARRDPESIGCHFLID